MNINFEKSKGGVLMPSQKLLVRGRYSGTIIRDGCIIDEFEDENLVVNEGLNAMLNVMFNAATQITAWYAGIFEGNYTPVSGLTAATVAAAATECTAYASATRPTYDEATSSAQSTTNSASRASFVFNASKTIYGAFLISNSTKSGTAGTLFSAARFGSAKSVISGDELLLTYTLNLASA